MERENKQDESVMISALSIDNSKSKKKQNDLHDTDSQSESSYSSVNDNYAGSNSSGSPNDSQNQSNESEEEFKSLDYIYISYITMALYESPTERKLKFDKICEYVTKKLPLCQLEGTINVKESVEKNLHACKSFVKIPDENDKTGVDSYWMLSPDFKNTHFEKIIIDLVKSGAFMEAFNRIEDLKSSFGDGNKSSVEATSKSTLPKITPKSIIHNPDQKEPTVFFQELTSANDELERGLSYFRQQLCILRMVKLGILGSPTDLISTIINPLPTPDVPIPLIDDKIAYLPEEDDDFQEEDDDDDFEEAVVDLQDHNDDDSQEVNDDFQDATTEIAEEYDEFPEEDDFQDDDYEDPY